MLFLLDLVQSGLQVGDDVVRVLEADRQPEQGFADADLRQFLDGVGVVRHAGGMLDQRKGVAQADGQRAQLKVVHELRRARAVAVQLERHHAAEPAVLVHPRGERVLRMVLKPRVADVADGRVAFEELRHLHGVRAVAVHADVQRLEPARDQERVERRRRAAGHVLQPAGDDPVDQLLPGDDRAGDDVAVAV